MPSLRIPKLAVQIGSYLSIHELSQCVRVDRTWQGLFTPLLWRNFPGELPMNVTRDIVKEQESAHTWNICRPLVADDYKFTHSRQQEPPHNDNFDPSFPVLSRNGHWIQTLQVHLVYLGGRATPPGPFSYLDDPYFRTSSAARAAIENLPWANQPTGLELSAHLIKQCPNIRQLQLSGYDKTTADPKNWIGIANSGLLGTIEDLCIHLESDYNLRQSRILPIVLARCPLQLQSLSIHVVCQQVFGMRGVHSTNEGQDMAAVSEGKPLPVLRDLTITSSRGNFLPPSCACFLSRCVELQTLHIPTFERTWAQDLEGCAHLKTLKVDFVSNETIRLLAFAMTTGLPSLDAIRIGAFEPNFEDGDEAAIISACRSGWRSVCLPRLGPISADALVQHCSTLEIVSLSQTSGLTSKHILQILSTSSRLESFVTLDEDNRYQYCQSFISVHDFIDLEPSSDFLNPWPCEPTLKVFRAKISGIPRPDVTQTYYRHLLIDGMAPQESYPGQGQELQRRVYERLARLSRLERLELGSEDRRPNGNIMHDERLHDYHDARH